MGGGGTVNTAVVGEERVSLLQHKAQLRHFEVQKPNFQILHGQSTVGILNLIEAHVII